MLKSIEVIDMRKEVVMSEQEFYDLKSAVTAAKRMLDNLLNDKERELPFLRIPRVLLKGIC